MFSTVKDDLNAFREALKGQDLIFYLGLSFIILYYLRPQVIISGLDVIPWLQITILGGFLAMIARNRLKFTGTHFLVFLFAALAWLSAKNSLYPEISSRDITTPFIFALEVLFLSNCVKNVNQLKLLLIVFFLCIFKMSFFGARVWAARGFGFTEWGIQGPAGFFQNSGEFSLLMAMCAVMSIPLILQMSPKTKLYWLLPITAIMTVLGASSRGGQLALVIGLVYLLLAYKKLGLKSIVYLVVFCSVVWAIFPQEQKQRFETAGSDTTSTSRLNYWSAGIDMAMEHPLLGVGLNAFPEHYYIYYRENDGSYLSNRKEVSHNSLIQIASTLGIPALLLYLWFHFSVFSNFSIMKNKTEKTSDLIFLESLRVSLNGGVLTYFIGASFMSIAFYPYIYLLLALTIIKNRVYKELVPTVGRRHNLAIKSFD
ncbi:O-antigen ligase [Marinobacter sp. es.042]|uniref:O-antigen ligase family protein n=1 Tax=Marinobacter sp. es.042 TaxID=1761794 RepID=UPI000B5032DB|nr:O-antigen ligase family protein [Marinobacter sp. es.042]SNB55489.1 O-antigen ligase [Marinobacter sp. es.042]